LVNLGVGSLIATSPSNLFVGTLYDHGIIGAILLALVFIVLLVSLIWQMRRATPEHRVLLAAALAAFVNMTLQSFESSDFWAQGIAIYFWIIMALSFALCWSKAKQSAQASKQFLHDDEVIQAPALAA
jgi:O-antigen ligase